MNHHPPLSRRHLLALSALGGAAALASQSQAAAPLLGPQTPGWHRAKFGDAELTVISDGVIPFGDPAANLTGTPKEELDRLLRENFIPTENFLLDQNVLVLNTGRHLVLFDTGMGRDQTFGPTTGRLLANLRAAGITPEQIDVIAVSHAHIDHYAALLGEDGRPAFPNARIAMAEAEHAFWTDEAKLGRADWVKDFVASARRSFEPLRERLTFVADGQEVVPGVTALATPGHTVGHTAWVVSSGARSLLVVGDLAHDPVLVFQRPRLEYAYDTDPKQAVATRQRVFDMAAAQRMAVLSYHFPFPGIGYVTKAGEGYRWYAAPMGPAL